MDLRKTKLGRAVVEGNIKTMTDTLKQLLSEGRDPHLVDTKDGVTYLHLAAAAPDRFSDLRALPAAHILAATSPDLDTCDVTGATALQVALAAGNEHVALALVRYGASVKGLTFQSDRFSPTLRKAISAFEALSGGLELAGASAVERWVRFWPALNCQQMSALHGYIKTQNEPETRVLLEKLAGVSALGNAILRADTSGLEQLLKAGIPTSDVLSCSDDPEDDGECGVPLLSVAWRLGIDSCVRLLLKYGTDVNVTCRAPDGATCPVFLRILEERHDCEDLPALREVLQHADLSRSTSRGYTALHLAVLLPCPVLVLRGLVQLGCDLCARDTKGRTARDIAETHGLQMHVALLDTYVINLAKDLQQPALEELTCGGYSPLLELVNMGLCRREEQLSRRPPPGSDPEVRRLQADALYDNLQNLQDCCGKMQLAVASGDAAAVRILATPLTVRARDLAGVTCLHRSLMLQPPTCDVIRELCHHGGMQLMTARDALGRTALHYAFIFCEQADVISVLRSYGASPQSVDSWGYSANSLMRANCSSATHAHVAREIREVQKAAYMSRTHIESRINSAVKRGSPASVSRLMRTASSVTDTSRYSHMLFDTVGRGDDNTTRSLMSAGCSLEIYRTKCDGSMEGLDAVARSKGLTELAEDITKIRTSQKEEEQLRSFTALSNYSLSLI